MIGTSPDLEYAHYNAPLAARRRHSLKHATHFVEHPAVEFLPTSLPLRVRLRVVVKEEKDASKHKGKKAVLQDKVMTAVMQQHTASLGL